MFIRFIKVFSDFVRKNLLSKYQFTTLFTPFVKNRLESRKKKIRINLQFVVFTPCF